MTSGESQLEEVRRLAQVLPLSETDRFPDALADAFRAAALWKLWVPRCYGGSELDLPASMRLFEAAACIDGSIGFAAAIGTGGGLFAAYLPEETAAEIFIPADVLIAGSGKPAGTAHPESGGYRVSGQWQWASLIHHATWVTANTVVEGSGKVMAVAVPAGEVRIINDWHAHALGATDSQSISMRDVTVPANHTFSLARGPRIEAPLYQFPFEAIAAASFAAVTLGIARGAAEAFEPWAQGNPLREQRLEASKSAHEAASSRLLTAATQAWEEVVATATLSEAVEHNVHVAAVDGTAQAVDAVQRLAELAGMQLLETRNRFSRAWRDVNGMAQHALISASRRPELNLE